MQRSYIVRVYRHEKDNPAGLVGIVEKVGEKQKAAFTNIEDLWSILNNAGEPARREKGKGKKRDAETR